MKKLLCTLLLAALLMSAAALAQTEYAMCSTPTLDGTVYIRQYAGAGQPILGVANNGDTLIVLNHGNTWHKVKVVRTGIEGYIYGSYVTFLGISGGSGSDEPKETDDTGYTPDASVADTDSVINRFGTISSSDGYANLRWGPGTQYSSIARLYNSTQVYVLEQNGSWYRCKADSGRIGYISKNLVTLGDTFYVSEGLTGVIRSSDGYANIRSGAGTGYSALYTLNVKEAVTAYGASGDWLRISQQYWWSDAYVYRTLVRFYSAATTTGNVNLRTGPSKNYEILRALPTGTQVTLLATDGSFCRVDTGKEIAYVSAKYLSF